MIKVSTTGMVVSLKTDLRFPIPGQQGRGGRIIQLTSKARDEFKKRSPKNAIILAAGFGMRMVPINTQGPKALMEVNGEPLIDRTIKQLHEVGVKEIHILSCRKAEISLLPRAVP